MVRRKRGFTLIELLVVITIIAVLAAILFPVFLMARAKARAMYCMSSMKQFGNTFTLYQNDWDDRFPYTAIPSFNVQLGGSAAALPATAFYNSRNELWTYKLFPYVKYELVKFYTAPGSSYGLIAKPHGLQRCKENDKVWKIMVSGMMDERLNYKDESGYGFNFLYLGLPFKSYTFTPKPADDASYNPYAPGGGRGDFGNQAPKLGLVKSPSETICLVENAEVWAFPPFGKYGGWSGPSGNRYIRPRHGSSTQSTVLWCDGHVTQVETRRLVTQAVTFGNYDAARPRARQLKFVGIASNNSLWDLE